MAIYPIFTDANKHQNIPIVHGVARALGTRNQHIQSKKYDKMSADFEYTDKTG